MSQTEEEKEPVEEDLKRSVKEALRDICFAVHKFLHFTFGVADPHNVEGEKPYRVIMHREDRIGIISDYVCLEFRPREVLENKTGILYVSFYSEIDYPPESIFGFASELTTTIEQHGFGQISHGTLSTEVMREWFQLERREPRWAEKQKRRNG